VGLTTVAWLRLIDKSSTYMDHFAFFFFRIFSFVDALVAHDTALQRKYKMISCGKRSQMKQVEGGFMVLRAAVS
jgi:hypothetical protein